ncbi:hypothetical protein ACHAWF_003526 [Thalassiosira exigua]
MSLSFVKSAVLSSTDGVSHNEETVIDSEEAQSVRASGGGGGVHKPLFEQLRANQEAERERDEEFQRSLRGTRPLDAEDCAHLDAVERAREVREAEARSGLEREVALFRAAKEDRGLAQTVVDEEEGGGEGGGETNEAEGGTRPGTGPSAGGTKREMKKIVPKFTIKKKRKRAPLEPGAERAAGSGKSASDAQNRRPNKDSEEVIVEQSKSSLDVDEGKNGRGNQPPPKKTESESSDDDEGGGLLGLGCYGSDSD